MSLRSGCSSQDWRFGCALALLVGATLLLASCGFQDLVTTEFAEHPQASDQSSFQSEAGGIYRAADHRGGQAHEFPLRLLVVGDTGSSDQRFFFSVMDSIAVEAGVDYVMVPGDLVYPQSPDCDGELERGELRTFERTLGHIKRSAPAGAKVVLALGNHDHGWHGMAFGGERNRRAERCLEKYVERKGEGVLLLPRAAYLLDLDVVRVAVWNSTLITAQDVERTSGFFAAGGPEPWRVVVAHHAPRHFLSSHDGEGLPPEVYSRFDARSLPQLWFAGHEHVLQASSFEYPGRGGQKATVVLSGSGSKCRDGGHFPSVSCSGPDKLAGCVNAYPGLHFSSSTYGYAVVTLYDRYLDVTFKDHRGTPRYYYRADRAGNVTRSSRPDPRSACPRAP